MVYINGTSINTRHNRPSVLSKTALITYFINDGQYTDPYQISAVTIYGASSNWNPSSIIGATGEIKVSMSSLALMNFANSGTNGALTTTSSFDTSNYVAGNLSGIYKLRTGVYAVVLDPAVTASIFNLSGSTAITNQVSSIGDYLDIWTVRHVSTSDLITIVNPFALTQDRFFSITEPIMFRVATRLENPYIVLGSKVDLKFTNEFTVENTNIDESMLNLFKDSFILNPSIEIYKENSDRNLASRVSVSGYTDTSSLADLTSDNTVTLTFDTSLLATHANMLNGTLGSQTGPYVARLKFSALNQTIISNFFTFIVR